jgi:hypothetical protein
MRYNRTKSVLTYYKMLTVECIVHNVSFLVKQKCQQHIFIWDERAQSRPPPPICAFLSAVCIVFLWFQKMHLCTGGGGGGDSFRLEQTYKHPPKLEKKFFFKAYIPYIKMFYEWLKIFKGTVQRDGSGRN